MEKQNSIVFWTKTLVILVILGAVYLGFELLKRSSFEYQKQSVMAEIKEFTNKYVTDEKDRMEIMYHLERLDEIFSKYKR